MTTLLFYNRHPLSVLRSYSKVIPPTLEESCYPALLSLASELRASGSKVGIFLSEDLVESPEPTLRAMCDALGIAWDPAMLSWPSGPKPEDGCWAPWWYAGTHGSTGFGRSEGPGKDAAGWALPEELRPVMEECQALYGVLTARAARPPVTSAPERLSLMLGGGAETGAGTHEYRDDPRNRDVLFGIRDGVTGALGWLCGYTRIIAILVDQATEQFHDSALQKHPAQATLILSGGRLPRCQ